MPDKKNITTEGTNSDEHANSFGYRRWLNRRFSIANQIVHDFGREAEEDAEIILCCALSALASKIWSGPKIDRQRFTQLLFQFSPPSFKVQTVSVCALIWNLEKRAEGKKCKDQENADKLIDYFFHSRLAYSSQGVLSEIIWPDKIDTDETQVLSVVPNLVLKDIRGASYASIIYSDLRSGLVHEYEFSNHVTGSGWHRNRERISYVNHLVMPDENAVAEAAVENNNTLAEARAALSTSRRRLYFPYSFIRQLIAETADSVFDYWDSVKDFSLPNPKPWWIDGK